MNILKKQSISLKAHLWLYFCSFAVSIMAILWILQILFLGAFFNTMKLNELKKAGNLITEQYDLNDENFYQFWFEHSFESGIFAHLISENGEIVQNFNTFPQERDDAADRPAEHRDHRPRFENRGFINPMNFRNFIDKVSGSDTYVSYIEKNEDGGAAFAVYGTYLGKIDDEKIYLYLVSPLERTDTTRRVLQTQLIIVSGLSILLALALAYFIAKRLSKPIENTTENARRLALGDYSVQFEKGSYKEIDDLSDTLNYATDELSRTEELRRDLISNVSHDLRTPLTIIKSYAEMIRDISGSNEEKRNKHTGVIIDETNKLSLLVNDMLDLSKIQSGTMAMQMNTFDLKALTNATLKRFEYYRETGGYTFETAYGKLHPAYGDERRIEQVIYNLLANAVNYTGDDKKIYVSVTMHDDKLRFSVRDTGCGIKDEEIDLVWDKYYKSSEKHKREKVGTGIGLSIVKNILICHNAEFGVNSTLGEGSEFWFELSLPPLRRVT